MISVNYDKGCVVWRLSPEEARDIANFIDSILPPEDYAHMDAKSLRIAANKLDPPEFDDPTDAEIEHDLEQRAHYDGLERDRE